VDRIEQWKKGPWLVEGIIGDEIIITQLSAYRLYREVLFAEKSLLTRLFLFLFILLTGKKNHSKTPRKNAEDENPHVRGFFVWCPGGKRHSRFSTRNRPRHAPSIAFPPLECFSSTSLHLGPARPTNSARQRDELIVVGGWGWLVGSFGWCFFREDEIELPCYIGTRDFFFIGCFFGAEFSPWGNVRGKWIVQYSRDWFFFQFTDSTLGCPGTEVMINGW